MRLGKYRLVKRLGMGGYCEVWKARDTVEGIWVALKIPHADVYGNRDNQAVLKEVRLVARLRHPNIMTVKNAEIIDGHAVLATELSAGTLDDCSRPMAVRRIITIMTEVLGGLAYAHRNHVVHCDVTPGNIFLLVNGHAAIGDFGIGLKVKGRMKTIDEYGTPGYVAPEQAFGKPIYRSDCFSVAVILYEFLTGHLIRWPFTWPGRGHIKLKERTSRGFVNFMKKALSVEPTNRFANAERMLTAMQEALPMSIKVGTTGLKNGRRGTWQQLRHEAFIKRYAKYMGPLHACVECGEAITEAMMLCPWCGSDKNRFDDRTMFSHVCYRCHRGVSGQWDYCPWCYGGGFVRQIDESNHIAYHTRCRHCDGKMGRFMRYCPWCRRKVKKPWRVWPFPELCTQCGWSIDSSFWNYCPWCKQRLLP